MTNFHFRKGDLLAVAAVILLAAALLLFALPALSAGGSYACIYQHGKLIREVPLSVDQTFPVSGDYTNTVTVQDGKIAVTHADCPNQDCVRQGWLSDGGAIVCLPNQLEIRLPVDGGADFVIP